jgi:RNA polymerase sigma-70 factor (ECF subfamily)
MLLDEQRLIQECQDGRLDSFDALYTHYVQPIYRFVYRRTLERAMAEDLTSQTFLKALEKIGTYDPRKGPFSAWLYRIARNSITDYYRTRRDHRDIEDVWDLASDDDTTAAVDDQLTHKQLRDALHTLPTDKREIVLLRLWENLSYQEIAAITGKSEGNCKVIFSRAVGELRKTVSPSLLAFLLLFPFHS